jgi:hypothetical protein
MHEQLSLSLGKPRGAGRRRPNTPNARWLDDARALARRICLEKIVVTIEDIRERCPLPKDLPESLYGKVFQGQTFEAIGRMVSPRPSAKGRTVLVYTLRFAATRIDS